MVSKHTIYDRFSSSLLRFCPQYGRRYGCPLTRQVFERSAIDDNRLSLEHCIPKGLGNNAYVLTAKSANNCAGAELESHLHRMLRHDEFFGQGVGTLSVRMEFGDAIVGADFTRSVASGHVNSDFQIVRERSNPVHLEQSEEWLKRCAGKEEIPIQLRPNDHFDRRLARIALLKAGYLLAFRRFGYPYILDSALNPVRDQILNPQEELIPLDKAVFEVKPGDYIDGILIVKKPVRMLAYIVHLRLRKGTEAAPRFFGVVLPATPAGYDHWIGAEAQSLQLGVVQRDIDFIENPQSFIFDV